MKGRLSILVISTKSGVQRKFSLDRKLLYCLIALGIFLLCSGIMGTWKYRENLSLRQKSMLLEAESRRFEAVTRTVDGIKQDETAIKTMLGLGEDTSHIDNP